MAQSHELYFFDAETHQEDNLDDAMDSLVSCNKITTKSDEPENGLLQPIFNWLCVNLIKNTFQLYAQHDHTSTSSLLKNTYHSPFPALNIKYRSESVSTDNVDYNVPATDDGYACAQLFFRS